MCAKRKNLEQRKPYSSSSFNEICFQIWFESFENIFDHDSVPKKKRKECISSQHRCNDQSCFFNNCKDMKALSSAFHDDFNNSFWIDVYEIIWSALDCIESKYIVTLFIKIVPSMKIVFLASMRIEVGFNQGQSMNGINIKMDYKCCGKNVFRDPAENDSEGLVSSFGILEDAMLSLPMAFYYHRLNSVAMLGAHTANAAKFIRNRLLCPSLREEEPDFDHIRLCTLGLIQVGFLLWR